VAILHCLSQNKEQSVKNLVRAFLVSAAVCFALTVNSQAQNVFNGIGSSALFLELGEAAYSQTATVKCAWSTGTNGQVVATDTSTGSSLTDTGSAWVVWFPTTGNTCTTNAAPAKVFGYLQTDSVVGNRCLFNAQAAGGPFCSISYANATGSPAGKIEGSSEVSLPSAVGAVLTGNIVNAAGTDIRPEDAEFAITRALTPCGSSTTGSGGSIAPYLGLGYTNGGVIRSHFSSSTFNVINFTLPAHVYVQPVGVDPIVVTVNSTDAANVGFNSVYITNISKATLAAYLDGSLGTTSALEPAGHTYTAKPTAVIVREPLSGTYNTMEYSVPNSVALGTSQDVGVNQPASQQNCSGTVVGANPLAIENTAAGSWRYRAIGTGQELNATYGEGGIPVSENSLGYAFWGVSNFAAAPATSKYLTVDGVDPIKSAYSNGVIPTTSAELATVNFAHLGDGTYPIWSLIRIVTADTTTAAIAKTLAVAAAKYSTTAHPDFMTYYSTTGLIAVNVERSHFAPPGITFPSSGTNQPANGGNSSVGVGACTTPEAGGDVGGVILNIPNLDQKYCTDTGSTYGMIHRRN
jgi:hypothetical protein